VRRAQIFVAVLGASNFTYAEARWTQSLPDWCQWRMNSPQKWRTKTPHFVTA